MKFFILGQISGLAQVVFIMYANPVIWVARYMR